MSRRALRTVLRHSGFAVVLLLAPGPAHAAPLGFNRDIRPILSENCFFCHGPDKNKRKAGLRLDLREAALKDEAIVPGKPADSEMWRRVSSKDPEDVMPPPDTHRKLKPAQLALLQRWIKEGAAYEPHWAYVAVRRPAPPQTKAPASNPIDAFIGKTLEDRGLTPSPPADRRTLLRRASLDLTGLPPTPEEVRAFAADERADAFERQVDRLLASPHFGERWAVPWLDVVRFADTVGYHGDQNINVFPYRDYVIDAFNANVRFDQFTIEQLAGDLLPHPTTRQIVATGFNRLNMVTREGGAQPKEYLAKYMADRVRAVGATWLGATIGCAECHDHKYDPIATRDFYSLGAFFADVRQWGVYNDYTYTPNPDLKGWSNEHPFPPEITVPSPYLERRAQRLRAQIAELTAAAPLDRAPFDEWRAAGLRFLGAHRDGWAPARLLWQGVHESKGKDAGVTMELRPEAGWLAALRLELGAPKKPGATAKLEVRLVRASGSDDALEFHFADATAKEVQYRNGHEALGLVPAGWKTPATAPKQALVSVWELAAPVRLADGDRLAVTVAGEGLGSVQVTTSPFAAMGSGAVPSPLDGRKLPAFLARALRTPAAKKPAPGLREVYLLSAGDGPDARRLHVLLADLRETRGGRTPTVVTVAREPLVTRVLPRGNWQDETGEIVQPATPHFLPQPPSAEGRRLTRLDLARWLVSRDNPLTARTTVNRLWRHLFGTGLSSVLNDLGAQGETPSHPELLDWLAAEFMDTGWDWKRMVKLMVTSRTYQQDSTVRPEVVEVDPQNRLLARQSQRRLDAEFVRDNALAIAGLVDLDVGGPSAFPYQPAGYYENIEFPRRDWVDDHDQRQWRRGVYAHWQRTFVHPMLANFDAPSREECTADRPPSNTPQQALTLLNDPTFVEASRAFAASLLGERNLDDGARIERAFERAVLRPPRPDELAALARLLGSLREHYAGNGEEARKLIAIGILPTPANLDPAELAAWTQVCRVVLNLYDTVTRT